MNQQAIRRPRWALLLRRELRHWRVLAIDAAGQVMPASPSDVAAFLAASVFWLLALTVIGYTLGLLP